MHGLEGSLQSWHSPLGAVGMTRVALPILIGVLENEAVGPLQAIRTFFHTIWAILKMETLGAVVRSLESMEERNAEHSSYSVLSCCTRGALAHTQQHLQQLLFPKNWELPAWLQPLLGSSTHINPAAFGQFQLLHKLLNIIGGLNTVKSVATLMLRNFLLHYSVLKQFCKAFSGISCLCTPKLFSTSILHMASGHSKNERIQGLSFYKINDYKVSFIIHRKTKLLRSTNQDSWAM